MAANETLVIRIAAITLTTDSAINLDATFLLTVGRFLLTVGNIPVTTTTKIFPKVSRYKWEAYCNTNGRRTAIQMGGVLTVFPCSDRSLFEPPWGPLRIFSGYFLPVALEGRNNLARK